MRAVIDTSILVRAIIKPLGTVGPVLQFLRDKAYTLVYSEPLFEELVDVLGRPRIRQKYHVGTQDVEALLMLLMLRGEAVVPDRRIVACRDVKDGKVLEAAVAGRADRIVTGDKDLLDLNPFEGIEIIGPAQFLANLRRNERLP